MPLQEFVKPIINNCLEQLQIILPQIHSIYLYGSAAKVNAIQGKSDTDLTIVLNQTISKNQQNELTELQTNLQTQYPQITKIDFDFREYKERMSQNELYRWGY